MKSCRGSDGGGGVARAQWGTVGPHHRSLGGRPISGTAPASSVESWVAGLSALSTEQHINNL